MGTVPNRMRFIVAASVLSLILLLCHGGKQGAKHFIVETEDKGSDVGDYSAGSCGAPCADDSDCPEDCRNCRSVDAFGIGAKTCHRKSWNDENLTWYDEYW